MITLIATGHKESGLVNSKELYNILERIEPEIIFEEIPPGQFNAVYEGLLKDSLETLTIKKYLENYSIDHFPVDIDNDNKTRRQFRDEYREMVSIFNDHDDVYNYLSYQFSYSSDNIGFPYLNSDECSDLLKRKNVLEKEITQELNLVKLSNAYDRWLDYIDKRRDQMIASIYSYSNLNRYNNGLFLVGAEHRSPLIDKVKEFERINDQYLDWNFRYFD